MLFHDVTTCHRETVNGYVKKRNAPHELKKCYYEVLNYNLNTALYIKR
jgi:hypothetical protein